MNILVNGIGNIGTTLLGLLSHYRNDLGIGKIYALKNTPLPWQTEDLDFLRELGIEICVRDSHGDYALVDSIIDSVDYLFDCTNNGGGMKNREWYLDLPNLKGACAQGSEKRFGKSYMIGVNDAAIQKEKFVHVVSCNTHSLASLLSTFTGKTLENLKEADFVIVRRSEDIGNHQRLVTANVVARHLDDQLGTHHAIDVIDLYNTVGLMPNLTSSDVTTPSQLMHGVRFNISLKESITQEEIQAKINENPFLSTTTKFDSNVIFERGRRIGFHGRIFSHGVLIANNMIVTPTNLKGWAFIPQEGNTLLSTISAFLLQTEHSNTKKVMQKIMHDLLHSKW